jgi:hypothetical protein
VAAFREEGAMPTDPADRRPPGPGPDGPDTGAPDLPEPRVDADPPDDREHYFPHDTLLGACERAGSM